MGVINKLPSLFGIMQEPVIAAQNGEIIFRNSAAHNTPVLADAELITLIPELAVGRNDFLAETEVAGVKYMLSGTTIDEDITAFVFRNEQSADMQQAQNVISSLSTALREPTSVLSIAAGQLLPFVENEGGEKLGEYAKMMHKGIYSVMRALNRFDAFIFMTGGAPAAPERTWIDLTRIVGELIDSVTKVLDLGPGELAFSCEAETVSVFGDKRLIERMLLSLIGNAFIFSPEGVRVKVSLRKKDDKAIITVSDNGVGISDDVRFDVWTRYGSERDLSDTKRGAGFGLSVVQAISRSHGGGALLESRPGVGTNVTVSLAIRPEDDIIPVFDQLESYSTVSDMREIFAELVNIIPRDKFTMRYMD